MVNLKETANPLVHLLNFIIASGAFGTALSAGNKVENKSIENEVQVKEVKKKVDRMDERQRDMMKILIKIDTKMEDK